VIFEFPAEYNYISLLVEQERWAEAETALKQFLEKQPENLWGRVQLGIVLLSQQEWEHAEKVINALLGDHGDHVSVNFLASRLALQQDKFHRAKKFAETAVQIDPEFLPALNCLAEVLFTWSHFKKANEIVDRALELEPENLTAISFKIYLLSELDLEGGDELIKRSLAIDPMNVNAIVQDGKRLVREGEVLAATKRLEEAVALNPRSGYARKALLQVYRASALYYPFYMGMKEPGDELGRKTKFLVYVFFLSAVCVPALLFCVVASLSSEQRIVYALLSFLLVILILARPLARALINVVLLRKARAELLINATVRIACQMAVALMLLSLIPFVLSIFYPELIYVRLYAGLLLTAALLESAFYSPWRRMRIIFGGLGIAVFALLMWALVSLSPLAIALSALSFGAFQFYVIDNRIESTARV